MVVAAAAAAVKILKVRSQQEESDCAKDLLPSTQNDVISAAQVTHRAAFAIYSNYFNLIILQ